MESLNSYEISWVDFTADKLSSYLDWVLDVNRDTYPTLESRLDIYEKSEKILKTKNDGYELEAERLAAIQSYQSKGFRIYDITPGLLDSETDAITIGIDKLFDGMGFNPSNDGFLTKLFRSVNLPIQGSFIKIDFLQEFNNISTIKNNIPQLQGLPNVQTKYSSFITSENGETDYAKYNYTWSYDNYSKNKVWIDFGGTNEKPHLVSNGMIFKTYFSEVNLHFNVGAPKVRITVGLNSEIIESDSESEFNSKLSMVGLNRLLKNSEQVLSPFTITDGVLRTDNIQGKFAVNLMTSSSFLFSLVTNNVFVPGNPLEYQSFGYNVFWVTSFKIKPKLSRALLPDEVINANLIVRSNYGGSPLSLYHTILKCCITDTNEINLSPSESIRAVIPSGCALFLQINASLNSSIVLYPVFTINGYSIGSLFKNFINEINYVLSFSRLVTDASLIQDFLPVNGE